MLNRMPVWFVNTSVVFTIILILLLAFGLLTNSFSVIGPITIDGRH